MRLILLLLLFPLIITAQSNFAPLGAEWNYEGHSLDCSGAHVDYRVEREVIVDGQVCTVIYAYIATDEYPDFYKSLDSLIVYEREDKVYFYHDDAFYPIFDFGLELGDTLSFYLPSEKVHFSTYDYQESTDSIQRYEAIVTAVSEVVVSEKSLRKYDIECIFPEEVYGSRETYIEGIGSISHKLLGEHGITHVASGCFGGLQCYTDDSLRYHNAFQFSTPNPSCRPLSNSDTQSGEGQWTVFPNPVRYSLYLRGDSSVDQLDVLSLQGQRIKTCLNCSSIDVRKLSSGVYLLKVAKRETVELKRFVKY